jgi:hypothetical protein
MNRETTSRIAVAALISALTFAACSSSSNSASSSESSVSTTSTPDVAPTTPGEAPLIIDDSTGEARGPEVPPDSTATTLLTVTTLPPGPTTTMLNNGGPIRNLVTGETISPAVDTTVKEIYEASIGRDYARLSVVIGDRRFRWGFVGQRRPAAQWQKDFSEGNGDQVRRIITLLETTPAVDDKGNTVWPYIAVKDPKEWTPEDEALALKLGFQPENVLETKVKGRYVDYRLVVDPTGIWTGMYVGG